jgi:hypothetical protein
MANSIKYVNYEVKQSNEVVNSGRIPSILTFSGSGEFYNLGGVWLWFTHDLITILEITDENNTVKHPSTRCPTSYVEYMKKECNATLNPY